MFWVPPVISGTGNARDFKFGQYIQRVHPNKIPLKILDKRERGHIQGLPNFFGCPLLSQERGKLHISNLASTFRGSIRIKSREKFWRKGSVGVSRDSPILGVPPIISGTGKAIYFKFSQYIQRVHPNKRPLKILEKSERGRIRGLPIFSGTPYYLRNGKSYSFQIWPVHSEGPSEQKPIKNFREKGAWAYPGTAQFLGYPLLSQEREKLRNFKFGQYI